jgi:hypothetical protein
MAIYLDENILLFLVGAIFVPLIIFLVKLIIDLGIIKGKMDTLTKDVEALNTFSTRVNTLETKMDLIDLKDHHDRQGQRDRDNMDRVVGGRR